MGDGDGREFGILVHAHGAPVGQEWDGQPGHGVEGLLVVQRRGKDGAGFRQKLQRGALALLGFLQLGHVERGRGEIRQQLRMLNFVLGEGMPLSIVESNSGGETVSYPEGHADQAADLFGLIPLHPVSENLQGANIFERGYFRYQRGIRNLEQAAAPTVGESRRRQHAPVVAAVNAPPHAAGIGADQLFGAFENTPQHGVYIGDSKQRRRGIDEDAQTALAHFAISFFGGSTGQEPYLFLLGKKPPQDALVYTTAGSFSPGVTKRSGRRNSKHGKYARIPPLSLLRVGSTLLSA